MRVSLNNYNWLKICAYSCVTSFFHKKSVLGISGTIITEWDEGYQICSALLSSESSIYKTIQHLVNIAQHCNFDGWLINIENKIDPDKIDMLSLFVKELTKAMHQKIEGSLVIWYDSVTINGELKWQNQLNSNNK